MTSLSPESPTAMDETSPHTPQPISRKNTKFLLVSESPCTFAPSPTTFKIAEITSHHRQNAKLVRKRKKYEVDNASTRVAMLSEYLEKENSENNQQSMEEDETQKKQKEWMKRSQALNAYFKDVDTFEVEETSNINTESNASKSVSKASSTRKSANSSPKRSSVQDSVNVAKRTGRKSTKRLNALI